MDDVTRRAIREATRGVLEYLRTGEAPPLSLHDESTVSRDRAIDAVGELLLDWEVLDGYEVANMIEAELRR